MAASGFPVLAGLAAKLCDKCWRFSAWSVALSSARRSTCITIDGEKRSDKEHCCFELLLVFTFEYSTSTIQHCPFTIQCPYFKCNVVRTCDNLIRCSMCLYSIKCDMLAMQSNILVFCIPNQYPYFAFKYLCSTPDIHVFQCNVDTQCVCCGAACNMPATRSSLDIKLHAWVTWPWDGGLLDNHYHTRSQGPLTGAVKMVAFRWAYDIAQQMIEMLDNSEITSKNRLPNSHISEPWWQLYTDRWDCSTFEGDQPPSLWSGLAIDCLCHTVP